MSLDFDPYALLGVSADATTDEIKAAYRRAARRLHPDVNHSSGAGVQFQDITVAHDTLSDPSRRSDYDRQAARELAEGPNLHFTLRVTPSKRTVAPLSEPQVVY